MTDETLIKSVSASYTSDQCPCCKETTFKFLFRRGQHNYEKCLTCNSARINPQPTDMELDAIYKRGYYTSWGDEENYSQLKKRMFKSFFTKHMSQLPPKAKVLDIGAANGHLMEIAAELGYEPYGVEIAEDGCNSIKQKFGPERVCQGYFSKDSFIEMAGQFDAVIMFDVIEHVREPNETIQIASQLLKKGGAFVAITPMMGSVSQKLAGKSWEHFVTEHLFYFSTNGIKQLVANNGLKCNYVQNFPKRLNISYIEAVMKKNGTSWYLVLIMAFLRIMPKWVKTIPFNIRYGQMLTIAQK